MSINNRLKEIRMKEYMMNQIDFAKMLDINMKVYNNWERGQNIPSLEKAMEISKKLNRKIEDIWY
ncbi:helix-turn-helix transcriptional regulator [Clostridium cadaveris]|uniref:helix-turn-helix transcriptional regulator n=1 Tax=Clostridium cadaveris TaxID=1529 RepID=UPI001E41F73A|nr:helix-turn-helix domain-containing protein [Clostridium cadaveris]UFH66425.1 helix-turn-helix domain-containing protein [Clostridium cadaveris]